MHDPLEIFRTVIDTVAAIVDTDPEPHSETPCSEWTYAQLLGHLVGGDRVFVGLLTGAVEPPSAPRLAPDADQPAPTPADYRAWSTQLADRVRRPRGPRRDLRGPGRPAHRRPGDRAALGRALPARLGSGQGRRRTDRRARTRGDRARRPGPAAARGRRRPDPRRAPALRRIGGRRRDRRPRSIGWSPRSDATRDGHPIRSPATPASSSGSPGTMTSSCPTAPAAASVPTACGYATRCSPAPTAAG